MFYSFNKCISIFQAVYWAVNGGEKLLSEQLKVVKVLAEINKDHSNEKVEAHYLEWL